jgi:hypothetical protein
MSDPRIDRDRAHGAGSRTWYFPDGYLPEPGPGPAEAHEALMVLNPSLGDAHVEFDLYFEGRPPVLGIAVTVPAERVRAFKAPYAEDPADVARVSIGVQEQYAIRVRSDVPVVVQYGRLETVPSYTLYTTMGYVDPRRDPA